MFTLTRFFVDDYDWTGFIGFMCSPKKHYVCSFSEINLPILRLTYQYDESCRSGAFFFSLATKKEGVQ